MTEQEKNEFMCSKDVEARVGLTRSTIYRLMRVSDFPAPVKIGDRNVRWIREEIEDWLSNRPRATGKIK